MTQPDLNLWPIGNCQVSALIDQKGRFVWACVPRVDGDPAFNALLRGNDAYSPDMHGYWSIELEDCVSIHQEYRRNTPILVERHIDANGAEIEIVNFCPRLRRLNRVYRPVAFVRIIRPISGSPRIRVRLRPSRDYGHSQAPRTFGSNHIRYELADLSMRLTTDAPVSLVAEELPFRLEAPMHFFLGPDEPFADSIGAALESMLLDTTAEWQHWVRGLATPIEWQEAVIRAAITLKLCQHEETGAIVAALTTSIPEAPNSGRNWDYRFCWIRDAYYTVQALNRLGALDVLEGYLGYLRNIVDNAKGGDIQPLYGVLGETRLHERTIADLPGYRSMAPRAHRQRSLHTTAERRLRTDCSFQCSGIFRQPPAAASRTGRLRTA